MNKELQSYVSALEKWFAAHKKVAVAFSGGVDSSLLLFLGTRVLGPHCLGLFAQTPLMSEYQVTGAQKFAGHHNLVYEERKFSPFHLPGFSENDSERCYICKKGLYEDLKASLAPGWHLADGTNVDDTSDDRPGFQAIGELKVATPYLVCGLGKREIRSISRALGLSTWNKPSDSCLATRIPRDTPITEHRLQQVEIAEAALRHLGFEGMRAQPKDDKILLTFKEGDLERALTPEMRKKIQKTLAGHSFSKVFIDLS